MPMHHSAFSSLLLVSALLAQTPPTPRPTAPATTPPAVAGPTEQERLLRILSGAHSGGRDKLALSPLIRKLKPFLAASDAQVRRLATQGVELGVLGLLVEQQADFRDAMRALLVEGIRLAVEHPPEEGALDMMKEAAAAVGQPGGAFDTIVGRMREILRTGDEIQKCFHRMRSTVRAMVDGEDLVAMAPRTLALAATAVPGPNGIQVTSDVQLTVTNTSSRTLPSVTVIVDVAMDQRKIDAAIRAEKARWAEADPFVPDEMKALQADNLANALRYYERLRLGYGTMVHVPVLAAGSAVRLPFASAGDVDQVVEAVQVLVVTGAKNRHSESLDVAALRKAIENAVKRQPPRRRR